MTVAASADADMIVAVIRSEGEIESALDIARAATLPVWIVAGKGKFATVSDSAIRTLMRANGFIDTKTSGVSDRWTATRYAPR